MREGEEALQGKNRIQMILSHPLYRENFDAIQVYERDRRFCHHGLNHFLDVARLCYIYSLEDGVKIPREVIYAAALLHDIGRRAEIEDKMPHEEASAKLAAVILPDCGFSEQETESIIGAILAHREMQSCENTRDVAGAAKMPEHAMLAYYLRRADKASRQCFMCGAEPECNWDNEKKNMQVIL